MHVVYGHSLCEQQFEARKTVLQLSIFNLLDLRLKALAAPMA